MNISVIDMNKPLVAVIYNRAATWEDWRIVGRHWKIKFLTAYQIDDEAHDEYDRKADATIERFESEN